MRQDRGQATLEVAGTIPLVVVVMAMLLQLSVTSYAVAQTHLAAAAGARAASAATSQHSRAAEDTSRDALGAWLAEGSQRSLKGETMTVTVEVPLLFPGVPINLGAVTGTATVPRS